MHQAVDEIIDIPVPKTHEGIAHVAVVMQRKCTVYQQEEEEMSNSSRSRGRGEEKSPPAKGRDRKETKEKPEQIQFTHSAFIDFQQN